MSVEDTCPRCQDRLWTAQEASNKATVSLDVPVPFSLELLCCVVVSCVASCFGTSLQQCEAIRSPLESHGVHWSPMEITNMRDSSRGGRPRLHEANPACLGGECGIRFMGGGRGPMKRILHARGEHAGFASWEGAEKVLSLPKRKKIEK